MKKSEKLPTFQKRLLLPVNCVLAGFVILFLYLDYRTNLSNRLTEKKESLTEEAKTILPGVLHLRHHGLNAIQDYINDVCNRMEDKLSPFHHIGVKIESEFLQSQGHHSGHVSLENLLKLDNDDEVIEHEGKQFVLGIQVEPKASVYVVEEISHIQTAVQVVVGQHFVAIVVMGVVAVIIVNVLLLRLVNQPIKNLVDQVKKIGSEEFDVFPNTSRTKEFNYLVAEVNKMCEALSLSSREREASLARAKTIQLNLLPKNLDGLGGIEIGKYYRAAEDVGGDFLDVRNCGDNKWFICVADSSGHGVPAAMSAAMIKTLLFKPIELLASPKQLLCEINKQFMTILPYGEFATVFLAFADLDHGELIYANAGHGPGYFFPDQSSSITELSSLAPPLGIETVEDYSESRVPISNQSRLVLTTDGITETFGNDDELYGSKRLVERIRASRNLSPGKLVDEVVNSMESFRASEKQLDDATILVVDFKNPIMTT